MGPVERRDQGPGRGLSPRPARTPPQPSERLAFWYGSDKFAPPEVEREYLKVAEQTQWPNPTCASAGSYTTVAGPTGVKMMGPYEYEPPVYWYGSRDGARSASLRRSGPARLFPARKTCVGCSGDNHLWPQDNVWNQHSQGGEYTPFAYFNDAMRGATARPGPR